MHFTNPTGLVSGWPEYTTGTSLASRLQLRVSPTLGGGLVVGLGGAF